jgi:hypothetical protein
MKKKKFLNWLKAAGIKSVIKGGVNYGFSR